MEEKQPQAQEERKGAADQQRRRSRPVFQYIAVLFAAAFILLLYTFLMERRQNELIQEENREQIANLQQSVSTVQSLENLYKENEALREQVDELQKRAEMDQKELERIENLLSISNAKLNGHFDFLQLEEWMRLEQYEKAARFCAQPYVQEEFKENFFFAPDPDPDDPIVDSAERFQEIVEELIDRGCLLRAEDGAIKLSEG